MASITGANRLMITGLDLFKPDEHSLDLEGLRVAGDVVRYAMAMNDVWDNHEFAQERGGEYLADWEQRLFTMRVRENSLRTLGDERIERYIDDANTLEALMKRNALSIIEGREYMNLIPTTLMAELTWGVSLVGSKLGYELGEDMINRYNCIRIPISDVHARIKALHDLSMIGQLRDDEYDRAFDQVRGIRTFATVLDYEEQEDLRAEYMERVSTFGFMPVREYDFFTKMAAKNKVRAVRGVAKIGRGFADRIIATRNVQTLQEVWGMRGMI